MNVKDKLWWASLKILKRWSRAGLLDEVGREVSKFESPTVISIGGYGPVDEYLKGVVGEKRGTLITFDINPKHNPEITGDVTDISAIVKKLNFQPDLIIALEVLEHVPNFDKAIIGCHDALKNNGVLVLSTPWIIPIHDRPHDYYRFTSLALAKHLNVFQSFRIAARGNYFDSIVMLMLRGLFSGGKSGKLIMVTGMILSFVTSLPKVNYETASTDSCIGYLAFGYKK